MNDGITDVWNTLPLVTRQAICVHLSRALEDLRELKYSFIASTHQRIEASEPEKRYDAFQESLYQLLPRFSQIVEVLTRKEGEVLLAWARSIQATDEQIQFVQYQVVTDCTVVMDAAAELVPWLLKGACDGEFPTPEDSDFITAKRLEWSSFNPGRLSQDERKALTFRGYCPFPGCGKEVLKVASHRGGTEFDFPDDPTSKEWQRHAHYDDYLLLRKMILKRWEFPAWWAPGTTSGKEIASMRGAVSSVMYAVLKRELEQIIHELGLLASSQVVQTAEPSATLVTPKKRPAKNGDRHVRHLVTFLRACPEASGLEICREFDNKNLPPRSNWGARRWVDCYRSKRGTVSSAITRLKHKAELVLQSAACSKIV